MDTLNKFRGYVDLVFSWVHWLLGIVVVVFLIAAIAREFGHTIPYLAAPDLTRLLYLSGIWFITKR